MLPIDLQQVRKAVTGGPQAHLLEPLGDDELLLRIHKIADRQIRLRPANLSSHRVGNLLQNLPHLRPEPCAVLLNYLFQFLQLDIDLNKDPDTLSSPGNLTSPFTATSLTSAAEPPANPSVQSAAAFVQFQRRPQDLFDRFLDHVAALMRGWACLF